MVEVPLSLGKRVRRNAREGAPLHVVPVLHMASCVAGHLLPVLQLDHRGLERGSAPVPAPLEVVRALLVRIQRAVLGALAELDPLPLLVPPLHALDVLHTGAELEGLAVLASLPIQDHARGDRGHVGRDDLADAVVRCDKLLNAPDVGHRVPELLLRRVEGRSGLNLAEPGIVLLLEPVAVPRRLDVAALLIHHPRRLANLRLLPLLHCLSVQLLLLLHASERALVHTLFGLHGGHPPAGRGR
mmetsp:Transcript_3923/g.12348  ORF Transcript_3923/g.12348 Transcript_3923/m.12348 type:complete len:243 (-) Transcript_3923:60-788(-)